MNNYPALIVIAPLLGAFLAGLSKWIEERLPYPIALLSLLISLGSSIIVLYQVIYEGTIHYKMADWAPPVGIEYRIDLFNVILLVLVSGIALANLVASFPNVKVESSDRTSSFYVMYLLFIVGLLGVLATGDLFNLYVLIEITSLTSYTLIAMGDKDRGPLAALNYILIGVIGASFYLLGVGYIYIKTGSLNMTDVASILPQFSHSGAMFTAFALCIIGLWIKMALFPLHIWLPNAYFYAPIGFVRLVAPLMTKVMVYAMIRLMVTVFGLEYIFSILNIDKIVVWLGTVAILAGVIMALFQKNLKKMLTYIIVCEIGYMVGGAWLGNQLGLTGAILHIINDAIMTFALFLALGNIVYAIGNVDYFSFKGLFRKMPWTMAGFVLAAFSIIGVPPTCGFFSKWYLILGAFEAGAWHFACALIISSLICTILFFRIFEIGFFESDSSHTHISSTGTLDIDSRAQLHLKEAPLVSLIVLGFVSISLVAVGLFSGSIVNNIIIPFLR